MTLLAIAITFTTHVGSGRVGLKYDTVVILLYVFYFLNVNVDLSVFITYINFNVAYNV